LVEKLKRAEKDDPLWDPCALWNEISAITVRYVTTDFSPNSVTKSF
jgi:hypothetical protein